MLISLATILQLYHRGCLLTCVCVEYTFTTSTQPMNTVLVLSEIKTHNHGELKLPILAAQREITPHNNLKYGYKLYMVWVSYIYPVGPLIRGT